MFKKNILILLVFSFTYLNLFCQKTKTQDNFINLNFFEIIDGKPTYWRFIENGYQVNFDKEFIVIKDSLEIENEFGMALNSIPIELVRGKTVKITTLIQTLNFNKNIKAGLWCGVDNSNGPTSTKEWIKEVVLNSFMPVTISIEMQVDSSAQEFYFGVMAQAKEEVAFGRFSVSIDGVKYDDTQSKELTEKQFKWLKDNLFPLSTTDPTITNDDDLKVIGDMIGDAKVVALGEVTHGAKEIFDMKHRIVRYLAKNKGYDVFSIEDNLPECFDLNQKYVIENQGTAKEQIQKYLIWPWQTKEVESMLEWMRNYKQEGGKIQFTGFDKQVYHGILQNLQDTFTSKTEYQPKLDSIKTNTFMQNAMLSGFKKPDVASRDNILLLIDQLSQLIEQDNWGNKDYLQMNLKILKQSLYIEERDRYMAENFLDIMKQNPDSKFTIWAHNLHINRKKGWLGEYLNEELDKDYVNVGFVIAEGEFTAWDMENFRLNKFKVQPAFKGTLDYYLNSIEEPLFVMDLRKVRADNSDESKWMKGRLLERHTGSSNLENDFGSFDINRYDLLIFVKKINASELF